MDIEGLNLHNKTQRVDAESQYTISVKFRTEFGIFRCGKKHIDKIQGDSVNVKRETLFPYKLHWIFGIEL